jgi:diaminohydroxyphosphoribosylaminopyrimidine deaminase / 5-amino-6-(5-phosphoribosylamino)uracil reductase
MTFSTTDHEFMARALQLGAQGLNTTTPNPRVGCVIVRDGAIVGEGWHERAGEDHAEAMALAAAGPAAKGATVYVSLEPCNHQGRTPPCAEALVAAGVARVVAATQDPNPQVAGQGLARLTEAGIEVASGLLAAQARELNVGFFSRMERGRPWLRLKTAASLDGKTALRNGLSQWITSSEARADAHAWRARSCAILTGIGTVREDNPRLTVRDVAEPHTISRQPLRVVVDSRLETPLNANVLDEGNVLIVGAVEIPVRADALRQRGAEVHILPNARGKVDLPALLKELGHRGINEVMAETGFKLNGALVRERCVDELLIYIAPALIGDAARGMFDLPELSELEDKRALIWQDVRRVGQDLRIVARFASIGPAKRA